MIRRLPGHSRECSTHPEVGCVCGAAERASALDELLHAPCQRCRCIRVRICSTPECRCHTAEEAR